MAVAGIAADAVSFNTVCSAHARVGDVTAAVALLGLTLAPAPTLTLTLIMTLPRWRC